MANSPRFHFLPSERRGYARNVRFLSWKLIRIIQIYVAGIFISFFLAVKKYGMIAIGLFVVGNRFTGVFTENYFDSHQS